MCNQIVYYLMSIQIQEILYKVTPLLYKVPSLLGEKYYEYQTSNLC